MAQWRRALPHVVSGAWGRVAAGIWPVVQQTAAASAAWLIARHLVDHRLPFFAPIAAVVALNAARGERGANAVRLLLGVVVGILAADAAVAVLHHGYGALAAGTFAAMLVALALGGERIVIAQAAVSAILAVTVGGAAGPQRLTDALIGAGVALLFSQLVFPAEPVLLLRRAEAAALTDLTDLLRHTARALERNDRTLHDRVAQHLPATRDTLSDLAHARLRSSAIARHSPFWWGRGSTVLRECHNAGRLDLLGTSCLMLARIATAHRVGDSSHLAKPAPAVRELADILETLARAPEDHDTRHRAARRALDLIRRLQAPDPTKAPRPTALHMGVRITATDVIAFAGVDPAMAVEAARQARAEPEQSPDLQVHAPPSTALTRLRRRRPRRGR
ncbi:aromatic acid exporter family protein [Streptomyces albogriseolus]|uniref:aromatic acid exporter family protein n=1 Tax=Streptomyces albogriseolus TaxID=1887 RepID=UPI0037BDF0DA